MLVTMNWWISAKYTLNRPSNSEASFQMFECLSIEFQAALVWLVVHWVFPYTSFPQVKNQQWAMEMYKLCIYTQVN